MGPMTDPWFSEPAEQLHEDAIGFIAAVQTVVYATAHTAATLLRSAWHRLGRIR